MSENDKYMHGVGVNKRTRELVDATWDNLFGAWMGVSAVVSSPLVLLIAAGPRSDGEIGVGVYILMAIIIVGGVALSLPYFKAMRALKKHTAQIREETKKYGPGWARS